MRNLTLKQKIFRLVVGVVTITATLILLTVWRSTAEHIQKQLNTDLDRAKMVLAEVLEQRSELLLTSSEILTDDFGFKRAVATADIPTIESVLSNHGRRIDADLMSIISLTAKPIASVPAFFEEQDSPLIMESVNQTLAGEKSSTIIAKNGRLMQVIFTTIDAPSPIAIAAIGFEVDEAVLQKLQALSQLDTRILVSTDSSSFEIGIIPSSDQAIVIDAKQGQSVPWLQLFFSGQHQEIQSYFELISKENLNVKITLSTTVERVFSYFFSLLYSITSIALIAVLIAIFMAALLSKQLAKPIEALTRYAKKIASGNYSSESKVSAAGKELEVLADAFESMKTNIKEREVKISYQAEHDDLTGLYNRSYIEALLKGRFEKKECFQTIGINIFGFRDINDTFGYHNGDTCLRELAARVLKLDGIAARLTGGELLWVPEEAYSESELLLLQGRLQRDVLVDGLTIPLRLSFGVIECPSDTHNAEDLFRRMNIVLDEAQKTDEHFLRFDAKYENSYVRRLSIITELKKALANNQHELQLFYQPKLRLTDNKIMGVEALIRWQNDKLGFISPEDFITIAEQAGFINKITEWVYQQAIQDVQTFRHDGVDVSVAINISAQDATNPEQLVMIRRLLDTYALPSDALSFELTEGDLIKDQEQALQHLGYLREAGFSIAIDDFGTGYSSLAYLTQLPVNVLKIDKSFVLNLDTSIEDQTIVQTVIKLAHSFNMEVVAEGVETQASLELLHKWGCEWAQGYHICRPIPAAEMVAWYKNWQTKVH